MKATDEHGWARMKEWHGRPARALPLCESQKLTGETPMPLSSVSPSVLIRVHLWLNFSFLSALLCVLCGQSTFAAETKPPNIVFFLADDLGQRDIGAYGSTFYE